MAYIKVRKQSDGSTRYTAIIRLRSGKTIVHQEARTFAHRSAAVTWAKHREIALEDPTALTRVQQGTPTRPSSSAGTSRHSRQSRNGSGANRPTLNSWI